MFGFFCLIFFVINIEQTKKKNPNKNNINQPNILRRATDTELFKPCLGNLSILLHGIWLVGEKGHKSSKIGVALEVPTY